MAFLSLYTMSESGKEQLIYGIRAIIETIQAGKPVNKVWIQDGAIKGELMRELRILLQEQDIPYQVVPIAKLNRLTTKNHQGVIAYTSAVVFQEIGEVITRAFEKGEIPLILVCDRITDVRNFGAIARSAACAGAHAILVPSKGAAPINEDAVKTSAGALNYLPVCRTANLKTALEDLKNYGLTLVACTEKGDNYIYNAPLTEPCAIIMGSEEDGVSPEYLEAVRL